MTASLADRADPSSIAGWLTREHVARRRFEPFAARFGIDTMACAYDVQRAFVAIAAARRNAAPAGYKIGLTSAAMQRMCRIDTPVAGVVLSDRLHESGARLSRGDFGRLGIEFEIAMRIRHDLRPLGRPFALADVRDAVEAAAPAIEVVDDRHCDYASLDVFSLVADNAWNAGIVLGDFSSAWPELAEIEGRVIVDGAGVLDQGRGSDVLGHPMLPVVWLANHLAERGDALRRGDIVMTGSLVTTKFPSGPGCYRFEVSGLGAVEVAIID